MRKPGESLFIASDTKSPQSLDDDKKEGLEARGVARTWDGSDSPVWHGLIVVLKWEREIAL
jgi:hypothetical protein